MSTFRRAFVGAGALLLAAAPLGAATYKWAGAGTSGSWASAGNWDAAGVPVSSPDTILDLTAGVANGNIAPPANFQCNQILWTGNSIAFYNGGPFQLVPDSLGNAPQFLGYGTNAASSYKTPIDVSNAGAQGLTLAGPGTGTYLLQRPISGANSITVNGAATATWQFASNCTFGDATHGLNIQSGKVQVQNNDGLGIGPITMGNGATLTSVYNASAILANPLSIVGNVTFLKGAMGSSTGLGFTNTVDLQGAVRTLTVAGDKNQKVTLSGQVTDGGLTLAGTDQTAVRLLLSGTNNDYALGTTIQNLGWLEVAGGSSLGTGDVTVLAGGKLTLDGNAIIADAATFSVTNAGTATVNLNFTGDEVVNALFLNGVSQPAGLYNATNTPTIFGGTGQISVVPVPEPAALGVLAWGAVSALPRRRRPA